MNYYNNLYSASPPNKKEMDEFCCLSVILQLKLKLDHHAFLESSISSLEVETAIDSLEINKAPGN